MIYKGRLSLFLHSILTGAQGVETILPPVFNSLCHHVTNLRTAFEVETPCMSASLPSRAELVRRDRINKLSPQIWAKANQPQPGNLPKSLLRSKV
jgi:hypothetical protein